MVMEEEAGFGGRNRWLVPRQLPSPATAGPLKAEVRRMLLLRRRSSCLCCLLISIEDAGAVQT